MGFGVFVAFVVFDVQIMVLDVADDFRVETGNLSRDLFEGRGGKADDVVNPGEHRLVLWELPVDRGDFGDLAKDRLECILGKIFKTSDNNLERDDLPTRSSKR